MKKSSLLKELDESIKTEETATTIFLQHLKAVSSRFNFDSVFMKRFKEIIEFLITENKRHKKICEELYAKVKKVKKDDI